MCTRTATLRHRSLETLVVANKQRSTRKSTECSVLCAFRFEGFPAIPYPVSPWTPSPSCVWGDPCRATGETNTSKVPPSTQIRCADQTHQDTPEPQCRNEVDTTRATYNVYRTQPCTSNVREDKSPLRKKSYALRMRLAHQSHRIIKKEPRTKTNLRIRYHHLALHRASREAGFPSKKPHCCQDAGTIET